MKALNVIVILAISIIGAGAAIAQNAPPVSTTKVDGTENVYVFRYSGYQSMFIVTPQGVISRSNTSSTAIITTITSPAGSRSRISALPSLRTGARRNACSN